MRGSPAFRSWLRRRRSEDQLVAAFAGTGADGWVDLVRWTKSRAGRSAEAGPDPSLILITGGQDTADVGLERVAADEDGFWSGHC